MTLTCIDCQYSICWQNHLYDHVCVFVFLGSTNLMDALDDLPPGIGQYDDFHTIDWLRDIARDRMRHRNIVKKKQEGVWEKVKSAHDAWSGWLCVLLVGVAAGMFMYFLQFTKVSDGFSGPNNDFHGWFLVVLFLLNRNLILHKGVSLVQVYQDFLNRISREPVISTTV